ncbi:MAG: ATP-dependent sacrificial sulfur transferase LarE [Candidatus Nitrohelix vancouverensis]|uniref:ATP-dependent sacrificial sulfur transferase LarE n=1 Tax=Candidatus Nitrohelix vancouverensis TaxID=2705534 RepID=A0A7T0C4V9_9BACT|nr:MAG: ATP-dependent sacrificial sulfur transferase LarE [Candidatus Nitrohelix vancouverensis]
MDFAQKKIRLFDALKPLDRTLVAFSGGVDSALVLAAALETLGPEKVLAATAQSESLPERELKGAAEFAASLGAKHHILRTCETASPDYLKNSPNRCYHCKSELYTKLTELAERENFAHIVNGVNADDLGEFRPGIQAGKEANVISPLADAGMNKADVRRLAQEMQLPLWDKPAMACLSSRIPYGSPITTEKLSMVEQAEDLLISLGFPQMRVRHHGEVARIELPQDDLLRFFSSEAAQKANDGLKNLGFQFVSVDAEGFRSGKMNDALNSAQKDD